MNASVEPAAVTATPARPAKRRKPLPKPLAFCARLCRERPLGAVGALICLLLLFTGIFADLIAPQGYNAINPIDRLKAPSAEYWFGTDQLGRDIFARVVHGARLSVIVAFAATTLSIVISALLGILSGYFGGRLDMFIQRLVDGWMCFPDLILLIVAVAVLGPGTWQIIVILGLLFGISGSRIVRGAVLSARQNVYVHAAQSMGAADRALHHTPGGGDPGGIRPQLPGPGHSATVTQLGRHAQPGRAQLYVPGPLAGDYSRHRPDRGGVRHQHVRRRPARHARPAHARRQRSLPGTREKGHRRMNMKADVTRRTLLDVQDLHTVFEKDGNEVHAVNQVSFDVKEGEILAIVGESGSGKSITAMSLLRLIPSPPGRIVGGRVLFNDQDLLDLDDEQIRRLRGRDIAMIFQEPMTSLNPSLRIGRQLAEPLRVHGSVPKEKVRERCLELLRQVRLGDPEKRLDAYPHELSGGMRQRVMIAMRLACLPKLLIADEPTTALDVTVQAQILELLRDLVRANNSSMMLITHDLGVVARYADRINVMYAGRIVERGTAEEIFHHPKHPYTLGLMESMPRLDQAPGSRLTPIPGQPPDLSDPPPGCPFHPRCRFAEARCRSERPPLEQITDNHWKACWVDTDAKR